MIGQGLSVYVCVLSCSGGVRPFWLTLLAVSCAAHGNTIASNLFIAVSVRSRYSTADPTAKEPKY